MFFKKKASGPLVSLQAAQLSGLQQALALVKRIRITATDDEQESLKCGKNFRLLDVYAVKLVEIVTFEHVDTDKAKGTFRFWTHRLMVRVDVSLQRERTLFVKRTRDGFQEKENLDQWKPAQGIVLLHASREKEFSSFADASTWYIRDAELESTDDLEFDDLGRYVY
jgi:hypothetical protein